MQLLFFFTLHMHGIGSAATQQQKLWRLGRHGKQRGKGVGKGRMLELKTRALYFRACYPSDIWSMVFLDSPASAPDLKLGTVITA